VLASTDDQGKHRLDLVPPVDDLVIGETNNDVSERLVQRITLTVADEFLVPGMVLRAVDFDEEPLPDDEVDTTAGHCDLHAKDESRASRPNPEDGLDSALRGPVAVVKHATIAAANAKRKRVQ
jgi:hypothetical protein